MSDQTIKEQWKKPVYDSLSPDGTQKKAIKIIIATFFIIVLLTMSLVFNSVIPTSLNNSSIREAPTGTLLTQYFNDVVAFPVENNTYFIKGNTINFYNNGNIVKMTRNLSAEFLNISISENLNLPPQSNLLC